MNPALGIAPLSNRAKQSSALAIRARIIDSDRWLRLRVRTRPTPTVAASCTGPHKHNGPGLKLSEMRSFDREVGPTSSA